MRLIAVERTRDNMSNENKRFCTELDCYVSKDYVFSDTDITIAEYVKLHRAKAEAASKLGSMLREGSDVLQELGFKIVKV